jgi:L-alanine-DL-glutamate epimerase-like enolase superfamily enzyme
VTDWDRLKDLELHVEEVALERLERDVSSDFTRVTTVIRLRGDGHEGAGEDVVYDAEDHPDPADPRAVLPLTGRRTLGAFADHLATLDLFGTSPDGPLRDVSPLYRTYAYESAALDLALRQAGAPLHAVVERTPRPVTFVVSLRLGEPPALEPVARRLAAYPGLRFKLDATTDWTPELIEQLVATGAVDSIDLKGRYTGTIVDTPPDPELYRRLIAAFPGAWLEDPHPQEEVTEVLDATGAWDRVTWDAPIHGVADVEALPVRPRMVNVKPSRTGPLRELFATYAHCERHGIGMYGGGQFELGPGRGQIQLLAALYHPDTPNDVSPAGFHAADPPPGLPESPLAPRAAPAGFRWEEDAER